MRPRQRARAPLQFRGPDVETGAVLGFYRWRKQPSSAQQQNMSPAVEGLVRISTYAGRQQDGGLAWLSWCGGSDKASRKSAPSHGSTLLAVTSWFARKRFDSFDKLDFCYFDVAPRNLLQNPPAHWLSCQASFVYPPSAIIVSM